eukprot:106713_1
MRSSISSLLSRHLLGSTDPPVIDEVVTEQHDGDILILSFCLLLFGVFIGYSYESFNCCKKTERYFPHASANMILGFFVGLVLSLTGTLGDAFSFNPEFFFVYLLPPIIFSAGYNLPKDFFFHNFGSILCFAFIGTTLSAFFIGSMLTAFGSLGVIETMSFTKNMMMGSLISAVDPVAVIIVLKSLDVDEQLKVLLFGESVLNDAASVVINRVFVDIDEGGKSTSEALAPAIPLIAGIAIASMLIGTVIALFVALLHKFSRMNIKKDCDEIELAAFLLGAFLPYGIAEALGLSGICSVLFAGIMTDYYTYHHLSKRSQHTTRQVVRTLAYISELFVFIYLGMSFFLEEGHQFKGGYVLTTLLLCFCGRALSVFPLAFMLNMGRKHRLPWKHQIVLWYSGLRGPVAYALAVATPDDGTDASNIIVTTTIFIVAFTTLMLGGLAFPFLKWIKPPIMRSTQQTKTDTYDISNHWFNRLDRRFLRPYFGPKQRRNNNLKRPLSPAKQNAVPLKTLDGEKQGFDMQYVNTNTNEEEAEEMELEVEEKTPIKVESRDKALASKTNTIDPQRDSKSLVDYSLPRTHPPSFIDNPREQSDLSITEPTTQYDVHNMLEPPVSEAKAVTPPPNDDIMSQIKADL